MIRPAWSSSLWSGGPSVSPVQERGGFQRVLQRVIETAAEMISERSSPSVVLAKMTTGTRDRN